MKNFRNIFLVIVLLCFANVGAWAFPSITGIGIEFRLWNGQYTVLQVVPDTPAYGKLQANDQLLKVNGQEIKSLNQDQVKSVIAGQSGTSLNVLINRGGASLEYTLVRERFRYLKENDKLFNMTYPRVITSQVNSLPSANFNSDIIYSSTAFDDVDQHGNTDSLVSAGEGVYFYNFAVKNNLGATVNNSTVSLFSDSELVSLDPSRNEWVIPALAPNEVLVNKGYPFYAYVSPSANQDITINLSVLVKTGETYGLSNCPFVIKQVSPQLGFKLYSRDVDASVLYVSTANSVPVLVGLTNLSQQSIPTLDVRLVVSDPLLSFEGETYVQQLLIPTESVQLRLGELKVSGAVSSTFNSEVKLYVSAQSGQVWQLTVPVQIFSGGISMAKYSAQASLNDIYVTRNNPLAYPNPFSDTTQIVFNLDEVASSLKIKIYDKRAQLLKTIDAIALGGGLGTQTINKVPWDGRNDDGSLLANGVYYYVVDINNGRDIRKGRLAILR